MAHTHRASVAWMAEATMSVRHVSGWQMSTRWSRDLSVIIDTDSAVILAAGLQPLPALRVRWEQRNANATTGFAKISESSDAAREIVAAWRAFEAGDLAALDRPAVQHVGGGFQEQVWQHLRDVAAGEVVTYAELARRAGRPAAVRAVGTACATNLIAPFTPCHRVIRSDGTLGGYGYGVELKRDLLAHEGALGW